MCQVCQEVNFTENKIIHREGQNANKIFNQRNLENDYKTLKTALRPGLRVLDIGCGTGSITKDIAELVGPTGYVIGVDNTESFILEGRNLFGHVSNLELVHSDIFNFDTEEKFDLIVSARTFQWISTIDSAVEKIKSLLRPNGQVSILDYNHEAIDWTPKIPMSMQHFYSMFLMWRRDAGMNNRIGFDLEDMFQEHGFEQIEAFQADEHYERSNPQHIDKIKIWSQVAGSNQMVEEGYISDQERLEAIEDYNHWVDHHAISMTMKLREVRAILK